MSNKSILNLKIIRSIGAIESKIVKDIWFDSRIGSIRVIFNDGKEAILSTDLS